MSDGIFCRACGHMGRTHDERSKYIECFCKHPRARRAYWSSNPPFGAEPLEVYRAKLPDVRPPEGLRPSWCPICSQVPEA